MSTLNVAARYIALFLQASAYAGYVSPKRYLKSAAENWNLLLTSLGCPLSFIVFYSWISSSFPRPPAKRAVAIALVNAFSQLGNVAGSYVWDLKEDGYRKSYGIVTAMFGVTILGSLAFRYVLVGLNNRLEEKERASDEGQPQQQGGGRGLESIIGPEEAMRMTKGFRYLV